MPFFSKTRPTLPERHWSHSQAYHLDNERYDDIADSFDRGRNFRSSASVPVSRTSSRNRQPSVLRPSGLQLESTLVSSKLAGTNELIDRNEADNVYQVNGALFDRAASTQVSPPIYLSAETLKVVSGRDRGASVSTVKTSRTDLTTGLSDFTDDEMPESILRARFDRTHIATKIAASKNAFESDDENAPDVSTIHNCDFITPCHARDFTRGEPIVKPSGIWGKVKAIAPSVSRSKTCV